MDLRTVVVCLAPVLFLTAVAYQRRWVAEDAFIDLRVVQHLLAGHGPVFNLGERVEAYTNPLWIGILALWGLFGGQLEAGAMILGWLLSVGGLLAAQGGALALARQSRRLGIAEEHDHGLPLPLGVMVITAVPATWDFVTSGLETGLVFGWLGISFWLLVRCAAEAMKMPQEITSRRSAVRWAPKAAVLGLGPLIRPDMLIFTVGFLIALVICWSCARGWRHLHGGWLGLPLAAVLLPGLYEGFRMGYFAALVPNTALAKEAGEEYWAHGWRYAADFIGTYWLWIPALLLFVWWAAELRRLSRAAQWPLFTVLLVPVLAALFHGGFIVRVGGDFMHGRLLLPSLFAATLPLAIVVLPTGRLHLRSALAVGSITIAVAVWAAVCALSMRVHYYYIGPGGIADERGFYAMKTRHAHPTVASHYKTMIFGREGEALRTRAESIQAAGASIQERPRVVVIDVGDQRDVRLPPDQVRVFPLGEEVDPDIQLMAPRWNVGVTGYLAGLTVALVDKNGLSDPIASRLRLETRGRPGHEKSLPNAWVIARFASSANTDLDRAVVAARAALACGDLAELRSAVEEPLTLERFLKNVRQAWRLYRLRIPVDPVEAQRELCT